MTTAAATRKPPTKRRNWVIDWPVSFGRFGSGDDTGSISVKVDREIVKDLNDVSDALAGTRIKGRIVLGHAEHARGQTRLAYDEETAIEATFDSKSFLTSGKRISFGLTFNLKELGARGAELMGFAKHDGRFQVESVSAIGGDPDDEEETEEDGDEE